jgi:hypothetical protein
LGTLMGVFFGDLVLDSGDTSVHRTARADRCLGIYAMGRSFG